MAWQTFLALNYTMVKVRVISDAKIGTIPNGESMPYVSNFTSTFVMPDGCKIR